MKLFRYIIYIIYVWLPLLTGVKSYAIEIATSRPAQIPVRIQIRQIHSSMAIVDLVLEKSLTNLPDSKIETPPISDLIRLNLNSSAKSVRITILKAKGTLWKSSNSWIIRSPSKTLSSGEFNYYQRGMNFELGALYIPVSYPQIEIQLPIELSDSENQGQLTLQIDELNLNGLWKFKILSKDNLLKNRFQLTDFILSKVESESSLYAKEISEIRRLMGEYDQICQQLINTWNLDTEYSVANLSIDDQSIPFGTEMTTEKLQEWHDLRGKIYVLLQKMTKFLERETDFAYSSDNKLSIALGLSIWSNPTYLGQLENFLQTAPCSMSPECSQSYHQWLSWIEKFKDKNGVIYPDQSSKERIADAESFLHIQSTKELVKDLKAYRLLKNKKQSNENIEVKIEK